MADDLSWSVNEIDLLICLVRENEVLYNPKLPGYSNRDTIEFVWSCIASRIETKNAKLCAKKWQILRAGYRSRRNSMPPSGSGVQKMKKWVYYDSLSFLEPFFAGRNAITNTPVASKAPDEEVGPSSEVAEEEEADDDDTQLLIEETSANTSMSSGDTGSSRKFIGKRKREESDDILNEYLKKKMNNKDKKSYALLFMESLVGDVEKLSARGQRTFQLKVRELLNNMLDEENIM